MKKIILIDGNNLLFRSYYATVYTGSMMRNSKGFPTNALYGFVNMINKIIAEEVPSYMIVAFDKGKTFRHASYEGYKAGRNETPEDLLKQFPVAKELLDKMGIFHYEIDNYEADDIIGTVARMIDEEAAGEFLGTIISSDRDLLQLVSKDVDIKLLKQSGYLRLNVDNFEAEYGIPPIRIIDLKGLQGDSSDNIPGVKGIGEKTALKLLSEFGSLEGIYANLDKITGKNKEKLLADRDNAFMSKSLATIYREVPLTFTLEDLKYRGANVDELLMMYNDLEFYSLLKTASRPAMKSIDVTVISRKEDISIKEDVAFYFETDCLNYHNAQVTGVSLYNETIHVYMSFEVFLEAFEDIKEYLKYTYDLKKHLVLLRKAGKSLKNVEDMMIISYLLNYNIKDDISYLANQFDENLPLFNPKKLILDEKVTVQKAKFIFEHYRPFMLNLEKENMKSLYYDIELPLVYVLADMEYTGVKIDQNFLNETGEELKIKIELLEKDIYNNAGCVFNIASPRQLGEILFEKLKLPYAKKTKTGYSTDKDVLQRLEPYHPIIPLLLEYRMMTKIFSTYVEGLKTYIKEDGKIHTIFNQTLTRTGRLSSQEPNLQNIPIRYEYGRIIRKAFLPSEHSIMMSSDYSQVELRILAHISKVPNLIEAFQEGLDIHAKTAMDIFHLDDISLVTKDMRRKAKAVNFGIMYGISGFGLSENLDIDVKEAKEFIHHYLDTYPGVKKYMDHVIEQAHEDGYVTSLMNRKRVINELKSSNKLIRNMGERMALNTPIQSTSADLMKKAMIDIYEELTRRQLKSKMLIQVHDELVFDLLESEKDIVTEIVRDKMEHVFTLDVPLVTDICYGNNWYETK